MTGPWLALALIYGSVILVAVGMVVWCWVLDRFVYPEGNEQEARRHDRNPG